MTAERTTHTGMTDAQYEVVNMLSCLQREEDVQALKALLVQFLNSRLQAELDRMYDVGALSNQRLAELSSSHLRTPYGTER